MAVNWGQINSIVGSDATQTALGLLGAALKSKSDSDARDQAFGLNQQQINQSGALGRAQLLNNQQNANRADRTSRAEGVLAAAPLGAAEGYATKQRLMRALLGNARNFNVTPGDPAVAAAMGKVSGGMRLPEGGLPPELLAALSEGSIANAIQDRQQNIHNLDYNAASPDLMGMGLPDRRDMMEEYRQKRGQSVLDEESQTQEQLMKALNDDATSQASQLGPDGKPPEGYEFDKKTGQLKKKGTAWWKKALAIGGSIAAAIATGGASIPVQLAVQGGVGAAGGALLGGKSGALTGALGGALGPALGGLGGTTGKLIGGSMPGAGQTIYSPIIPGSRFRR